MCAASMESVQTTNGQSVGSEIGALQCDEETGSPVILDLGMLYIVVVMNFSLECGK